MFARISVSLPTSPDREFRIQKTVFRVGSSADCEVPLEIGDLAPHALTLQKDGEAFRILCRTVQQISLDGKPAARDGTAIWRKGSVLRIDETVTLSLDFAADTDSAERAAATLRPAEKRSALSEPSPSPKPTADKMRFDAKNILEALALVPVLAFLYFMTIGDTDQLLGFFGIENGAEPVVTYAQLLQQFKQHRDEGLPSKEFLDHLAIAYRSEQSGNTSRASTIYRSLLSELLEQHGQSASTASPPVPAAKQAGGARIEALFSSELDRKIARFLVSKIQ